MKFFSKIIAFVKKMHYLCRRFKKLRCNEFAQHYVIGCDKNAVAKFDVMGSIPPCGKLPVFLFGRVVSVKTSVDPGLKNLRLSQDG